MKKRNNYFKLGYWIFVCAVLLTGCSKKSSTEERIVVEDVKEEMEEEKMKIRRIAGKLYHISRYLFSDPVERAYIRLYVTDGDEKMFRFNDLDENSIVFDGGGTEGITRQR